MITSLTWNSNSAQNLKLIIIYSDIAREWLDATFEQICVHVNKFVVYALLYIWKWFDLILKLLSIILEEVEYTEKYTWMIRKYLPHHQIYWKSYEDDLRILM